MEKILLAQFIAHIIADFFAQPPCFVACKREHGLRSWYIYIHAAIVFATSLLMTFSSGFVACSIAIAILHLIIDAVKSLIERKHNSPTPATFLIDQLLHFAVIWLAVRIYSGGVPAYIDQFSTHQIAVVLGFLICLKPTNVMIRACLSSMNLNVADNGDGKNLEKAGRWIGSIERVLAFVMVLLGQFTAIGFIIAAKSVLRYGEKDTYKAEYVLIGTLLSFGIAVLLAIFINCGIFI